MKDEKLYDYVCSITSEYKQNIPYSGEQAASIVAKHHSKETGYVQYKIWQSLAGID